MLTEPLPIATNRLVLRRFFIGDLTEFQAYRSDPEIGRYQSWEKMSDDRAKRFIEAVASDQLFIPGEWNQIAIADRPSNTLVGDIGICVSSDGVEAELGITLSKPAQGKGLAGEALQAAFALVLRHTGVEKLVGITHSENVASIGLLQSLSMVEVEPILTVENGEIITERVFWLTR